METSATYELPLRFRDIPITAVVPQGAKILAAFERGKELMFSYRVDGALMGRYDFYELIVASPDCERSLDGYIFLAAVQESKNQKTYRVLYRPLAFN